MAIPYEIVALAFREAKSLADIAFILGCTERHVRNLANEHGLEIPGRLPRGGRRNRRQPADIKILRRHYAKARQ